MAFCVAVTAMRARMTRMSRPAASVSARNPGSAHRRRRRLPKPLTLSTCCMNRPPPLASGGRHRAELIDRLLPERVGQLGVVGITGQPLAVGEDEVEVALDGVAL